MRNLGNQKKQETFLDYGSICLYFKQQGLWNDF